MRDDISFAWRCWLVQPDREPWPDHNFFDQPEPPLDWHHSGFWTPWIVWGSTKTLSDHQVTARDPFSLAWCQRTQQYWVLRGDCTERDEPDESEGQEEKWTILYCHHLRDRPGLWELIDVGATRQHDSICPSYFDEFLPKNFFIGTNPSPEPRCHFVGHLSLILALLAMCPRDVRKIPRQINEYFYHDNEPRFIPWRERISNSPDLPMDRYSTLFLFFLSSMSSMSSMSSNMTLTGLEYPGRAIVMQTGLINNDRRSTEDRITAWERGRKGPMVSSDHPTDEEWQAWG